MFCRKRAYKTKEQAVTTLHNIINKPDGKRKPVRAYLCGCGRWHLTSKEIETDESIEYVPKFDWSEIINKPE